MSHLDTIPLWAAIPAAALVLIGAGLALIGSWGLARLPSFYERIHAPTLGTSWGTAGIMLASMLVFSLAGGKVLVHELVIGVFIMLTTPVTLMLLGRASLYRDRSEEAKAAGSDPEAAPEAKEDQAG